jgi:hypothetical protein
MFFGLMLHSCIAYSFAESNSAILWLEQEFVYVGDEGVVEAGGQTHRLGVDASLRYELMKNLYADVDVNVAAQKTLHVVKEDNNIPLAPRITSIGGLSYRREQV